MATSINLAEIASFYNERFQSHGIDIRSVGWSNKPDQILRFDCLLRGLNLKGKSFLDVGCGLGDLVPYLTYATNGDFQYYGIDIASSLVDAAASMHTSDNCIFIHGDIFNKEIPSVDISVASGSLSFSQPGIENYAYNVLQRMYKLSSYGATANFLSSYVDYQLEKNHHYSPSDVLSWSKEIATNVNLFHDYPLYEFTVQLLNQS